MYCYDIMCCLCPTASHDSTHVPVINKTIITAYTGTPLLYPYRYHNTIILVTGIY